jgi:hypothetical protein
MIGKGRGLLTPTDGTEDARCARALGWSSTCMAVLSVRDSESLSAESLSAELLPHTQRILKH